MKATFKVLLSVSLSAVILFLFAGVCLCWWWWPDYYLPPEQSARQQFESHKADYNRFVTLLREDASAKYIDGDGKVDIDGVHNRFVPEYRELIRKIGAKFVTVCGDGSMEFALWGDGGTIMSDSYMGVRYCSKDYEADSRPGWAQKVVLSLDGAKLPQEKGSVASGLYVVAIEPEWSIYRLEIQE